MTAFYLRRSLQRMLRCISISYLCQLLREVILYKISRRFPQVTGYFSISKESSGSMFVIEDPQLRVVGDRKPQTPRSFGHKYLFAEQERRVFDVSALLEIPSIEDYTRTVRRVDQR